MQETRRSLLRRIGGVAAAGTTAVAGCQGLAGPSEETGANSPTGTESPEGASDDGAEGSWLVAPDALGLDHYGFTTMRPSGIWRHEAALSEELRSVFDSELGLPGTDTLASFDAVHLVANAVQVMEGPFDRDGLAGWVTESGFEQTDPHRGYDRYTSGESRAYAMNDERFVQVGLGVTDIEVDAETALTAVLDAHAGAGDRYRDVDDCARLLSALGEGDVVMGRTDEESWQSVEGAAAEGARWRVTGEETAVAAAIVYPDADATDESAVESWASEGAPFGETAPSVATDGRAVTASSQAPTGEITGFDVGWTPARAQSRTPTASFSFEYDPDAGTVTVVHDGGDSIPASKLAIEGDGFTDREGADQTSPGEWRGSTDDDGRITAGHQAVVGVTADYALELVYHGDRTVTLGIAEGPDA